MAQGLVVTICAPSQSGKDYMLSKLMKELNDSQFLFNSLDTPPIPKTATAWKKRKRRDNDPDYIKCFSDLNEVEIPVEDQIRVLYGEQFIIYDKKEIDKAITNGEVIFIATCVPQLCREIKSIYGNNSLGFYIRNHRKSKETLTEGEAKRHNEKWDYHTNSYGKESQETAQRRVSLYEFFAPEYINYAKDATNGADWITRNWWTYFNSDWTHLIDGQMNMDFNKAFMELTHVYQAINNGNTEWRKDPSLQCPQEERDKNPLSLQEDFLEYRREKLLDYSV